MGSRRDKVGKGRVVAINLTGGLLRKLIGVGVAIAIGVGWWGFNTFKEKAGAPDVGECVTVSGSSFDADVDEADCGGDDVLYKVVDDEGDCDTLAEVDYTVEVNGNDAVKLCLAWEVEAGDCVDGSGDIERKVDCASSKGGTDVYRVTTVEDTSTASCAKKQDIPVPNKKRDVLVCVTPNV
jgi:hypothetical protein